jgi:CRP/FNR family transcriptional regulator, cyclic AMP receptor protein
LASALALPRLIPKVVTGPWHFHPRSRPPFDPKSFLALVGEGRSIGEYRKDQIVFSQGDPADAVFYIQKGKVKVTVVSEQGKEAVVAILGTNDFGEGCLAGQALRIATVATMMESVIVRLEKTAIVRVTHEEPAFSEMFIAHLLGRTIRVEADLVDQLFNSSEKRLARLLLLLANFGKDDKPEPIIAKISQETLAEMIGTTRSKFFHEQISKTGLHSLQRRHRSPQFIVECRSARRAAHRVKA